VLSVVCSKGFERDVKLAQRRGKDMSKLKEAVRLLEREEKLPDHFRDHPLKGEWKVIVTVIWNRIGCSFIAWKAAVCTWLPPARIDLF